MIDYNYQSRVYFKNWFLYNGFITSSYKSIVYNSRKVVPYFLKNHKCFYHFKAIWAVVKSGGLGKKAPLPVVFSGINFHVFALIHVNFLTFNIDIFNTLSQIFCAIGNFQTNSQDQAENQLL